MIGLNLTYFTAKWSFHYTYKGYQFSSRKACEFANAAKDFTFNLFSNNTETDKPNIPVKKVL